jgi:hypothetical protein
MSRTPTQPESVRHAQVTGGCTCHRATQSRRSPPTRLALRPRLRRPAARRRGGANAGNPCGSPEQNAAASGFEE